MDQMIIEFQYVFVLFTLASLIPRGYGVVLAPVNPVLSRIVAFGCFTILVMNQLYLLVVLLVKYVSIYHSATLMSCQFDEAKLILRLRIGLYGSALFLSILQFGFLTSMDTFQFYQMYVCKDFIFRYSFVVRLDQRHNKENLVFFLIISRIFLFFNLISSLTSSCL
jgi:hypothetical protein